MSAELLPSLLATLRWRRRRTRLATWTAAAAAAAVLTIGVFVGVAGHSTTSLAPQTTASALPMAQVGTTLLASTVSLSRQQWGTHIVLKFVCTAPVDAHHDTVALVVVVCVSCVLVLMIRTVAPAFLLFDDRISFW